MRIENWNIEAMTGYKPISTFYEDFSIADMFGISAVEDTYKRAMDGWKTDYKMLTELVMVLNWKIWRWYQSNEPLARKYDELWREAEEYAFNNLEGEELLYFTRTID